MQKECISKIEKRMNLTIEDVKHKLAVIRTGRASLAILNGVTVNYYGTETPISQISKLSIPDPAMIIAHPFDPSVMEAIEKAILKADLGLNPISDGKVIRIPIPPLTEERRKQLGKKVNQIGEEGKTALRQIRRDGNEEIKMLEKDKKISQDEEHKSYDEIQKITDKFVMKIDDLVKNKNKELMEL
ncbi:MAG: ribosome recycling factor [Acidobacteriota bacterium]